MKKVLLSIICLVILGTVSFADTSSKYIEATVPAIYEIAFVTANYDGAGNELAADTGEKVGEITITCNAASYQFKFHTSQAAYINSNTGYLVRSGGSIANDADRMAYSVYFDNESNVNHTAPGSFPADTGTATAPTDDPADNNYTFTGTQVTNAGTYDVNIVVTEGELQSSFAGVYISEITITIADS